MYKKISIIGAGTWGTAVATHLSGRSKVELLHYKKSFLKKIEKNRIHPNISNFIIPKTIEINCTNDISSDLCVIAVPVQNIKSVLKKIKIKSNIPILILSKGIDNKTLNFPSDIVKDALNIKDEKIAILSGPSHAEQVILKHPTSVVVSSVDKKLINSIQVLFSNNYFRLYGSTDTIGVQLGGAVKNVISIASGIVAGLDYKENTTSALVTRGLYEIKKLGLLLNAKEDTLNGLAGLGDLVVTSFSNHSRNRYVGYNIGKGIKIEKIIKTLNMKAEGIYTAKSVFKLIKKFNIEMPICKNVYNIIYKNKNPKKAIDELMMRSLKYED